MAEVLYYKMGCGKDTRPFKIPISRKGRDNMNETSNTIKGRFAPTPSGRMHLGNVLCALLAWLSAKSQGGKTVLRIEDLDKERSPRHFADLLEDDLRWLGLIFDEGPATGGPDGPYYQSERDGIYEIYYEKLRKDIYPCFCSRAALHAASAPHLSDGRVIYGGACRELTPQQVEQRLRQRMPAHRLKVPQRIISFCDGLQGPYTMSLADECGDFIVRRADGVFAYQLAVVIDDALMGVTEVVRGKDLLSSTPQQIWLYETLGFPVPKFYHIPLLTAPDGRRLSKRDEDLDLGILRQRYRPQELVGLLGHLCGQLDRSEPVSPQELAGHFDWDRVPREDIRLPADFFTR